MLIIDHRRNTPELLQATPPDYGVEMDLRSFGTRIVVHHDPFVDAIDFEDWLQHYRHALLILNVKEEGLEQRCLDLMARHRIESFFFLDQSFPFLIRTARSGERRSAVRVSEYESLDTALTLAGKVDWVWVDCFTRFPLSADDAARLQGAGFKLCLVSPELQGRDAATEIPAMKALLAERGIVAEAVCTKRGDLWLTP